MFCFSWPLFLKWEVMKLFFSSNLLIYFYMKHVTQILSLISQVQALKFSRYSRYYKDKCRTVEVLVICITNYMEHCILYKMERGRETNYFV